MKIFNKLLIPIMIITIYFAFVEQNKTNKNMYLLIFCLAIFILGMIKLSSKTPSKNSENDHKNV